jgi:hypothetical protein
MIIDAQQRAFVYLSIIAQDFIIEASTSRLLSEKATTTR